MVEGVATAAGAIHGFAEFVLERFPFAAATAQEAFDAAGGPRARGEAAIEALRQPLAAQLRKRLPARRLDGLGETTPGVSAAARLASAIDEIVEACDGYVRRAALRASLTPAERREILRGMLLTRATDNRLKAFFGSGEIRCGDTPFQGKGFRSLGQEAIYAAGIRLRRGDRYRVGGEWHGDVVAPVIRDLGVALAMRPDAEAVRMVLSAQMGKAGPPMHGKDLHVGDLSYGILPALAPLASGSLTIAGMAMAFAREGLGRVALSFIGEGGSSLGEWHEAINACAARRLPAIFCLQNNQTALSTPVRDQSAVRVFADKAAATASRASRSTAPIPTRSPRRSPGPPNARGPAVARRSSNSSACGCAGTRTMTTCCISARTPRRAGSTRRSARAGTPTPGCMPIGRHATPFQPMPSGSRPRDCWKRAISTR
jgi:hypothetical protein